ncbi:anaerobic ribonucleoside-triphosphate reductase activating protein [Tissierella sp. Yu-01]|uniref:anaerobic ribonucleoside-triphosphate reductase activating protein n=1 Tax=Tissierella sp. Yu-01 TaxID=3035694 RepID=UPI00240E1054|nr:anaerobic ribonucleoside-triphosphate reductase activating protein [Tissierella sp. Yu-01]WFA09388.1 anaerobic ribonucleoside-triphosphate reductase activating protein [Tissierella sp. Yu-01]
MTGLNISHSIDNNIKTIRVAGLVEESIVDGPGIRLVIFTQGCRHNCPGCHNPQTHDFRGGYEINIDDILKLLRDNPLLDGITLSGGDPFEQAENCSYLAKKVRELGFNVVAYTGYTFENLLIKKKFSKLLENTDILIDGKFDISEKDLTIPFRGSKNQRIIDVKKSFEGGRPCLIINQ